jgi:glycogen debranching enzyme
MTRRLLDSVSRALALPAEEDERLALATDTEWLVTNGLGGYSSSSVACANTRRYHGILVSALPNPFGRMLMLSQLDESVTGATGARIELGDGRSLAQALTEFRLEAGLPVWELDCDGVKVEKRVWMPYGQNTVFVTYRLIEGKSATIELRPSMHFRGYEDSVDAGDTGTRYRLEEQAGVLCVASDRPLPALGMKVDGPSVAFIDDPRTNHVRASSNAAAGSRARRTRGCRIR